MSKIQDTHPGERIAKVIARAGLCSRRDAELWINAGRVAVNGKVLESPAFNVTGNDRVTVDGEVLARRERTRLFFFHKPRGTVTTSSDPEDRTTVFDILPGGMPRVVSIGRLDINTEGLLLLTNDGGLARALELPSTGWMRRYRVRAHGATDQSQLDALGKGLTIDGIHYRGIEARLDREQGSNVWMTIGLREGKNREVRRVLEHIGLEVNRLIRVSYGPFQLGELKEGAVEEVKTRVLKEQLGDKIAKLASADFDAPLASEVRDDGKFESTAPGRKLAAKGGFKRSQAGHAGDPPGTRNPSMAAEETGKFGERPKPGKRRHVSALRKSAKVRAEQRKDRRRIERGETEDRKGRAVAVERVVVPLRRPGKTGNQDGGERPLRRSDRNARNFADLARLNEPHDFSNRNTAKGSHKSSQRGNRHANDEHSSHEPAGRASSSGPRSRQAGGAPGPSRKGEGPQKHRFQKPRGKFAQKTGSFAERRNTRKQHEPAVSEHIPWGAPQDADPSANRRPAGRLRKSDDGNRNQSGSKFEKSGRKPGSHKPPHGKTANSRGGAGRRGPPGAGPKRGAPGKR